MSCSKIKQTCGDSLNATCVKYQTELPSFSGLGDCDIRIEETTEELYNLIGAIKNETDLSALGNSCLEYVTVEGKVFVKNALLKMEQEICALKTKVQTLEEERLCNMSLEGCNLYFGDLVDTCSNPITTPTQLFQAIIDRIQTETP